MSFGDLSVNYLFQIGAEHGPP